MAFSCRAFTRSVLFLLLAPILLSFVLRRTGHLRPEETLLFFPTFAEEAYPGARSKWVITIEGVVTHESSVHYLLQRAPSISKKFSPLLLERLKAFFSSNAGKEYELILSIPPDGRVERKITVPKGYFKESFSFSTDKWPLNAAVNFTVPNFKGKIVGTPLFVTIPSRDQTPARDPYFSLVFDIDDTLKLCDSHNPLSAAEHHVALDYTPLPGTIRALRHLNESLTSGDDSVAPLFHYLGAAPTGLAPDLLSFLDANYPAGELLMNKYMLSGEGSVLDYTDFRAAKSRQVKSLVDFHPNRQFVFFGDNAISDAPVYAQAIADTPDQVQCAIIRMLPQQDGEDDEPIYALERMRRMGKPAFENEEDLETVFEEACVGKDRWFAFREWEEVERVDFKGGKCRP